MLGYNYVNRESRKILILRNLLKQWGGSMANLLAVLVAAIVGMVAGVFWFGPMAFRNTWLRLMGWNEKDLKDKLNMRSYVIDFAAEIVMAFVLAMFISKLGAATALQGAAVGFWAWLGFIATLLLGSVLWEGKPFKLYILNASFWLLNLLIMGAILGGW